MDRMSGLPMIKCSSCGIDIDILQLADHVCATAPLPVPGEQMRYEDDTSQAHTSHAGPPTIASAAPAPVQPQTPPYDATSPTLERASTFGGPSFSARYGNRTSTSRMPVPPRIDSQAASKSCSVILYQPCTVH